MRELRSHNSWMHNVPKLMQGDRVHTARVHPDDAAASGIKDGAICRVMSAHGSIELPAKLTDDVSPGTVAIPHGWVTAVAGDGPPKRAAPTSTGSHPRRRGTSSGSQEWRS
jgi:anaerobic selenocysteine-containing dehydrogenase